MLKLMRLENKKFKLFQYGKGVIIANLCIIAFLGMIYVVERAEGIRIFENSEMAIDIIGTFVRATFMIFSSVLIVRLFIDEYKNKTIEVLFTYPIPRKQIMRAKLAIVFLFTFSMIIVSWLFLIGLVYVVDLFIPLIPGGMSLEAIYQSLVGILLGAFASAGISMIPLFFGMRNKSAPTTIVSAILLSMLTNSNTNGYTMFSVIAIPLSIAAIGLLIAFFSIRNVDDLDVNG